MIINQKNYEVFVLDYLEGKLDRDTQIAFKSFLLLHPQIKQEIEAFEMVKVEPDTTLKHPNTAALFQIPQQKRKKIALWWYVGIAASFLLLLYAGMAWFNAGSGMPTQELVQEDIKVSESNSIEPKQQFEPDAESKSSGIVEMPNNQSLNNNNVAIGTNPTLPIKTTEGSFNLEKIKETQEVKIKSDVAIAEIQIPENTDIKQDPMRPDNMTALAMIPSLNLKVVHAPVSVKYEIDLLILNMAPLQEEASGLKKWLAKINLTDRLPDKSDLKESLVPEFIAMR